MVNKIATAKSTYFDFTSLEVFTPAINGSVHEGTLFKADLERFALRDVDVAIKVLKAIKLGKINIFTQERLLDWLQKYHSKVQHNINSPLSIAYFEAMDAIVKKVDLWFKYRQYHNQLTIENCSEYEGYGFSAVTSHILLDMRYLCTKEAFRHWATNYGRNYKPNIIERPGIVRLLIDSVENAEYAESLDGNYIHGAKIVRNEKENNWEIIFEDYFPNQKYYSIMWTMMYRAVIPLVEPLFMAKVYSVTEWQYTD